MDLKQGKDVKLIQVKKSIDWLIDNTVISVFDPVEFKGYQRQIDPRHCEKIVKYLESDFLLPTSIICAVDNKYSDDAKLRIVDGQHRVRAFKDLKDKNIDRYTEIKDYEMSVIVMENANELTEIDTFIRINKTSKKVDTSLAFVLKNKLNNKSSSENLSIPKSEFMAVELAIKLNEESKFWNDRILFEGNVKKSYQYISLNAFVKATRSFLYQLNAINYINLTWENQKDIDNCLEKLFVLYEFIWAEIQYKWNELYVGDTKKLEIIQGAIGYTSITRLLGNLIKENIELKVEQLEKYICECIKKINVPSIEWEPSGKFSMYTSESGYSIVAKELKNSMY